MKTRIWIVAIMIVLASVSSAGAVKPEGGYLGKFALGDTVAFTWTVAATEPPLWSVYRDDRASAGDWSGLFHCSGLTCWMQSAPDVWTTELLLSARDFAPDAAYMICAETEYGSAVFETWTFRVGGPNGNKPPAKVDVTACP